jgi:hypothetical protein
MTELIDYARPLMMAERAMKISHDLLLQEDFNPAIDQINLAIVELRIARVSIIHIMEKQNALREQIQTLQKRI